MFQKWLICTYLGLWYSNILSHVLIITHSYNRPDFIELQNKTFKTFLKDDYEYVVFNDAPDEHMRAQIEHTCQTLGLRHFRIPQNLHKKHLPGDRHTDSIQYSLKIIGFNYNGIVAIIDSDMFLIEPFSITKYLRGYDIAAELQGRSNGITEVRYIWPGIVFMDMRTLANKQTINFEGGLVEGLPCDTGGHTYYYFKDNPQIKCLFFGNIHIGAMQTALACKLCNDMTCAICTKSLVNNKFNTEIISFIQSCDKNIEFYLNKTFFHYRGGTNWDNKSINFHKEKTYALNQCIDKLIKKYS